MTNTSQSTLDSNLLNHDELNLKYPTKEEKIVNKACVS